MLRAVAILALVVATTSSQPPSPTPTEAHQHAERGANDGGAKPAGENKGTNPFAGSHAVGGKTSSPDRKANDDSDSTSSQWWFNFWLVIFTGALAVVSVFQLRAMSGQLAEMKTTSTDTHDLAQAAKDGAAAMLGQLEAYERPWLTVSFADDDATRKFKRFGFQQDDSAYAFLEPVITNIGKSLATDISVYTELIAMSKDNQLSLKARLEARTEPPDMEKFTLFPGEENKQLRLFKKVSGEAIRAAATVTDVFGKKYVIIAFIGEVLYSFANSKDPHHTQFAYVMEVDGAFGKDAFISVGATFSGDQLVWAKLPSEYAD